jgi:hypothetical protein
MFKRPALSLLAVRALYVRQKMKKRTAARSICFGVIILASVFWVLSVVANGGAYIGRGNDEVYVALDEGRFEVGWDFVEGSSGEWNRRGAHWNLGPPRDEAIRLFAPFEGELADFPIVAWASVPLWAIFLVAGTPCGFVLLTKSRRSQNQVEQAAS